MVWSELNSFIISSRIITRMGMTKVMTMGWIITEEILVVGTWVAEVSSKPVRELC